MKVQLNVRVEEFVRERLRLLAVTEGVEAGEIVSRLVVSEWDAKSENLLAGLRYSDNR